MAQRWCNNQQAWSPAFCAGRLLPLLKKLAIPIFVVIAAVIAARLTAKPKGPPEITPFKAPLVKDLPEFGPEYQDGMLWGSYRSGLYFGMRTR